MTNTSPNLQEKIFQLKTRFITQLPKRLAEIDTCISQVRASDTYNDQSMTNLHRIFHSLAGTSSSFGLQTLGIQASAGEQLAQGIINEKGTLTERRNMRLNEIAQQLQTEIRSLQQATSPQLKHSYSVPSFELQPSSSVWQEQNAPLIYICDDETEQVEQLDYQLSCFGYNVRHFTTLKAFEAEVLKCVPDAVVMDVHFPQSTTGGTEMLCRLNETLGRQLPSIVLSGQDSFDCRLSAYRAGCRTYFTKPARPLELASALDDLRKEHNPEPLRVLIVDDELEVTSYHSLILENAGMLVQHVQDPALALDAIRSFAPDLLLIDVYMPQCTGQELAGIIRMVPEYLSIPILYLSSETNREKQYSIMRVGVEGFITKPVIPEELVSAVALRAERMQNLRKLMTRDGLTGLYNHSTTKEIMANLVGQAARNTENLVMVMLDLDLFKAVNDQHGHLAGDQVLVALSRILKHRLRNTDIIGRCGGEEFAVLLRDISTEQAFSLIDDLRNDFSKIIFNAGHNKFSCTFSAGLSSSSKHSTSDQLIAAADAALYRAKAGGRNRINLD